MSIATGERLEAFDRSGSELLVARGRLRKYWLWPDPDVTVTGLTKRPEHEQISIDHRRKIYSIRTGYRPGQRGWPQDNDRCTGAAYTRTYTPKSLPDLTITGIHVVGYGGREDDGDEIKIYYAPSIGCQEFSFEMTRHNSFGLPTYYYKRIVDSYELGPPDSNLFKIPEGYRRVDSIFPLP